MSQGPCREAQNGYVSDKKAINHYASFKHRFDELYIRGAQARRKPSTIVRRPNIASMGSLSEGSSDKKIINHDRARPAADLLLKAIRIIWIQNSLR